MECTIDWLPANGMAFCAETGSGHLLTMDGAPDGGGRNLAPRPMETVLAGTGACSAYDVVLILQRGRHDVRGCRVKVTAERAPTDPEGVHRDPPALRRQRRAACRRAAVERAIALSHEKYCSATIMLGKTAEITTSYEIVAADAGAPSAAALRGSARSWSSPRPASRIAQRTGAGQRRARRPARRRSRGRPRRPSSARRSPATRDRRPAAGRDGSSRCRSTWRSVSTTKPRLAASPARPATRPMPKAPGVPERIEQARPGAEFVAGARRSRRGGRSPRRRPLELAAQRRVGRGQRLGAVERLGADLADVVDAHQGAGLAPLGVARAARRRAGSATGFGRAARGGLESARRAWSQAGQQAVGGGEGDRVHGARRG